MKRLLLVPHGLTSWNVEGRVQGHTDVAMNEQGRAQVRALARRLASEKIAAVFASDLQRALETASILSESIAAEVWPDPRLREIHFGDWEGLTTKEIAAHDPTGWERWEKGSIIAPPGGESLVSLASRLKESLHELTEIALAQDDGQAVMIVAHRGSLRVLICLALGLEPTLLHRFRLEQASLSELLLSAKGAVLNRLNDVSHLREVAHAR